MPTTKRINIPAGPSTKYTVNLVGEEYVIPAPKLATALTLGQRLQAAGEDVEHLIDELHEWVDTTFGKHADDVWKRLFDPKDQLDIPHITELIGALSEAATGNPSTSPAD